MAEGSFYQDKFSCPVCLDLLKDPVTIPCGHSFCMDCITECWNQDDHTGVYRCPQCRHTFTPRPALYKNVMFADLVQDLKKTKLRPKRKTAGPSNCLAGPEDVECDKCTGRKHKAVKSCLVCHESYCQTHFKLHEEFHSVKRHKVTDASGHLKTMMCSQHGRLLEVFCRTDQQCICLLCVVGKHKNHDTISATAERTEKQALLGETQRKIQQRIQEREDELQEVRDAVDSHKRSAQTAVEDSERIFAELIRFIERRSSEVTQLIRDQEKAAVSRAEGLLERLEQEIVDLRRRDAELEQLSHTDNHIHFLQSFQSVSVALNCTVSGNISPLLSFDDVRKSVSQLKEKLQNFCREEIKSLPNRVTHIRIHSDEHKTREEFLRYANQFTLDSNTVYKHLRLSDGNRTATNTDTDHHQYLDHPDRFDHWWQVLCKESVSGRCYWEVEWSGDEGVLISVAYKSISRKGNGYECLFGGNNQSWSLLCSPSKYSFVHNNKWTKLPVSSSSYRIGVYVDYRAGTLSFYSVSEKMTLIHKVQTTFTQPLYPGFLVKNKSTVKL
ncbi:tripartite motif-containing protein 16-like protein [Triplophysa rosa]|uniref:Tripartite motif-containing protein 16-like protein n=1 Tax=Triplophysa rosa TaxID=992332 RepID=A0A9W7WXR8_TRIRA|nr:tripartite motif-containing protein 16-like protein [Triplophysa rosa]KAI7810276.1 putative tripartite motif-containing protein 16-like protein [Triplophysa rosa]